MVDVEAAVEAAVRRLLRKRAPRSVEPDELRQEGFRIALQALDTYDPEKGSNRRGYVYIAVRRGLGNYISTALSVVSIGSNWTVGSENQHRVGTEVVEKMQADTPTPEQAALQAERKHMRGHLRVETRRHITRIVSAMGESSASIIDRLYGLDGLPEASPREVARDLGIDAREVYKVDAKFRRQAGYDLDLYGIHRQFTDTGTGEDDE